MNMLSDLYPVKSVFSMVMTEFYFLNKDVDVLTQHGKLTLRKDLNLCLLRKINNEQVLMIDINNEEYIINISDLKSTYKDITNEKVKNSCNILLTTGSENIIIKPGSIFVLKSIFSRDFDKNNRISSGRDCLVIFTDEMEIEYEISSHLEHFELID